MKLLLWIAYSAISVTSSILLLLLAFKTFGKGIGIFLAVLTLIPALGLLILLVVNQRAIAILNANHIRVGFSGARAADVESEVERRRVCLRRQRQRIEEERERSARSERSVDGPADADEIIEAKLIEGNTSNVESLSQQNSLPISDKSSNAASTEAPASEPTDEHASAFDFGPGASRNRAANQDSPLDARASSRSPTNGKNARSKRLIFCVALCAMVIGGAILVFVFWPPRDEKPIAKAEPAEEPGFIPDGNGNSKSNQVADKQPDLVVKKDLEPEPKIETKKKDPEETPKKNPVITKPGERIEAIWMIDAAVLFNSLNFSPDGSRIISSPGFPAEIHVYDAANGKRIDRIVASTGSNLHSLTVCTNDLVIVSELKSKPVVWDLSKRARRTEFNVGDALYYPPAVIRSTNTILIPKRPDGISFFSLDEGKEVRVLSPGKRIQVHELDCSRDGEVIVANTTGSVSLKRPGTSEFQVVNRERNSSKVRVALDGKHFLICQQKPNPVISIWKTSPPAELCVLEGHTAAITEARFTADGKHVLSVARDKTMRYWNIETGKQIEEIGLPGAGIALDISNDGKLAVSSTATERTIQLWRLPNEP